MRSGTITSSGAEIVVIVWRESLGTAEAPIGPESTQDPPQLRPAEHGDADLLLRWRNQPEVRASSRNTGEVQRAEHLEWLERTIADPARELLIVEADGEPVGQVRLDRLATGEFEVSVSLDSGAIGRGLGRRAIAAAVARLRDQTPGAVVVAEVRAGNDRSLSAFRAAGFESSGDAPEPGFLRLRSEPG